MAILRAWHEPLDKIKGLPPCKQQPALTALQNKLKNNLQNGTHSHTDSQGNTVNGLNGHGNVVPETPLPPLPTGGNRCDSLPSA